jgi:hypothetical protein
VSDPEERALAPLLDDPAVWAEVPPGLRDRVLAEAIAARAEQGEIELDDDLYDDEDEDEEQDGGGSGLSDLRARMLAEAAGSAPTTAPPPPPPPPAETKAEAESVVTPIGAGRTRGARAWRRPALLAAAAAVAFALGIGGGLLLNPDDNPKGAQVALAGTDAMPAASAEVLLDDQPSGVAVTLDVKGLPPAPAGTFYEAWLIGKDGKVSAGTFHLRKPQDHIRLWLGVDVDGYDAITVTRQPIVGGSKADGVVLLRGSLHPG